MSIRFGGFTLLAFLSGSVVSLQAGTFAVNPVRVELSARQPHSTIQIVNSGDEKLTVQVHPMKWGNGGNDEALEETDDVIVNPPIFTIAAHQRQFVRLGLREVKAVAAEATFRMILEEVPPPLDPTFNGLRTLLRISIPVFVAPSQAAQPLLAWQLRSANDQSTILSVQNRGNGHIQFKQISLGRAPEGEAVFTATNAVYVLPGGRREWRIDGLKASSSGWLVRAVTDQGAVSANLPPGP
jgi:fimbrial chaperone protein